jgi:hypothetical protein
LATIADSDLCHRIIAESRGLTDFQSLWMWQNLL